MINGINSYSADLPAQYARKINDGEIAKANNLCDPFC